MSRVRAMLLALILWLQLLSAEGQESLFVGFNFDTYFDNREYSQSSGATVGGFNDESGTFFSARLTPYLRYKWEGVNNFVVGCELVENFGEVDSKFLASSIPMLYYIYDWGSVRAASGIFPRDLIHADSYSRALFSDDYLFYNNLLSGFMGSYSVGQSFVELVIDWEGMRSSLSREKFRVLSGGRHYFDDFYYGYSATLFHFAKRDDGVHDNIVDYAMLNPVVGYKCSGVVDVSCRLGAILTLQRDRAVSMSGWLTPAMGEIAAEVSYRGLFVENELYVGANINPYYFDNGCELYPNELFFRGEGGVYNRTALGYSSSFFNETLRVGAHVAMHYDGYALASQYRVDVGVKILKRVYKSNKE